MGSTCTFLSVVWFQLNLFQDGDETSIYNSAQALITFQKLYGQFPRIVGKGDSAAVSSACSHFFRWVVPHAISFKRLATLLTRHPSSQTSNITPDTPSGKIDSLVILDRKVDMITPLLTQLTYEGLIDELIGIKNCVFRL
jgi:vacuolar protein sorting-associated protein 33A